MGQVFQNVKNNLQKKSLLANLALIVAAGTNGLLFSKEKMDKIQAAESGLIEFDTATPPDAQGNVLVRATQAGINAIGSAPAQSSTPVAKPTFAIVKGLVIPEKKRRGGSVGQSLYPFDQMEVGDAFLVPATADKPNPAKSMTSTVSAATRRYAIPDLDANGAEQRVVSKGRNGKPDSTKVKMKNTRRYEVRETAPDAPTKGALIFRVA